MLPQRLTAVLLLLPLLAVLGVGVKYFIAYERKEASGKGKQFIGYNRLFLAMVGIGYFGIYLFWLGGMALMFLDSYYTVLERLTWPALMAPAAQIAGLAILYVGALFMAWTVGYAGKSLRPSTSGIHADHILVQDGPLGIVRHPYYVSYVVILTGLGLTLAMLWPLLFAVCVAIGMVPTAEAEEKQLAELFGEEYRKYQQRVGRFFPKIR